MFKLEYKVKFIDVLLLSVLGWLINILVSFFVVEVFSMFNFLKYQVFDIFVFNKKGERIFYKVIYQYFYSDVDYIDY